MRLPSAASRSEGSSLAQVKISSERGFRFAVKFSPSSVWLGSSRVNRLSYSRTSASMACAAETQNATDSPNDHFGFWPPCWDSYARIEKAQQGGQKPK